MDLRELQHRIKARRWWHWGNLKWIPYRMWRRTREAWWSVRFAYQRVVRGYDDTALWSLDSYLTPIVLPVLKQIRAGDWGLPFDPDTNQTFVEQKWHETLDKMIFSFQYMHDEENMVGPFEDGKYCVEFWRENREKIEEGLVLFGKHFQSLWT